MQGKQIPVIEALWAYLGENGLREDINYRLLAKWLKKGTAEVQSQFVKVQDIFCFLMSESIENHPIEDTSSPYKDIIFETTLEILDDFEPYKKTIKDIKIQLLLSPQKICQIMPSFDLLATHLRKYSNQPWPSLLQDKVLQGLILHTFNTWISDDTEDSSETMVNLDRTLNKIKSTSDFMTSKLSWVPSNFI